MRIRHVSECRDRVDSELHAAWVNNGRPVKNNLKDLLANLTIGWTVKNRDFTTTILSVQDPSPMMLADCPELHEGFFLVMLHSDNRVTSGYYVFNDRRRF